MDPDQIEAFSCQKLADRDQEWFYKRENAGFRRTGIYEFESQYSRNKQVYGHIEHNFHMPAGIDIGDRFGTRYNSQMSQNTLR